MFVYIQDKNELIEYIARLGPDIVLHFGQIGLLHKLHLDWQQIAVVDIVV